MKVQVSISLGELVDKISILMIKETNITDPLKLELVKGELQILKKELDELQLKGIGDHLSNLVKVNSELWSIEDDIRVLEKEKSFSKAFVDLARSVYITNDKRFELKNAINESYGSQIKEVKSYEDY
jgi:hypothetical protein